MESMWSLAGIWVHTKRFFIVGFIAGILLGNLLEPIIGLLLPSPFSDATKWFAVAALFIIALVAWWIGRKWFIELKLPEDMSMEEFAVEYGKYPRISMMGAILWAASLVFLFKLFA